MSALVVRSGGRHTSRARDRGTEKDALVASLAVDIELSGLPAPVREHRFHPTRRWRLDLAWPDRRLYVEVHGGTWLGALLDPASGQPRKGAHSTGAGQRRDFEKQNAAVLLGWRPIVVSTDMCRDGSALATVQAILLEGPPRAGRVRLDQRAPRHRDQG
jgi:hypothetical protein